MPATRCAGRAAWCSRPCCRWRGPAPCEPPSGRRRTCSPARTASASRSATFTASTCARDAVNHGVSVGASGGTRASARQQPAQPRAPPAARRAVSQPAATRRGECCRYHARAAAAAAGLGQHMHAHTPLQTRARAPTQATHRADVGRGVGVHKCKAARHKVLFHAFVQLLVHAHHAGPVGRGGNSGGGGGSAPAVSAPGGSQQGAASLV